jgi:hypothetical protein
MGNCDDPGKQNKKENEEKKCFVSWQPRGKEKRIKGAPKEQICGFTFFSGNGTGSQ